MNDDNPFQLTLRVLAQPLVLTRWCDGAMIDMSEGFCRLSGYERDHLIGRRIDELSLWVDPDRHAAMLRLVQAHGEARDVELRVHAPKGEVRTLRVDATRVGTQAEPMLLMLGLDVTEHLSVERALADAELRHRCFIEAMPVGIMVTQHGKIVYANPTVAEMSGYSVEELHGISFAPLIFEEDRARVSEVHRRRMSGEVDVSNYELRMWRKDGALRHWRVRVQTVDWAGAPSGLSILTDMTDRESTSRRMRELSSIVEQTSEAIMVTATDGSIKYVNPGFERVTGYRSDEVLGKTPELLQLDAQDSDFHRSQRETISAGKPFQAQVVNRRKDGAPYHAVRTVTPMFDAEGRVASFVNIDVDFTAQHEAQQRAVYLAMHDPLTGLPNRALFVDRVVHAISHHRHNGLGFALLFIDLDGFKAVNDCQGHEAGDEVLKVVAKRLSARLRGADTVARIGGDEFVVLLQGVAETATASTVAAELIVMIREQIAVAGGSCRVGASVGMSVFPTCGETIDTLLRSADRAMYLAKHEGGNRLRLAEAV